MTPRTAFLSLIALAIPTVPAALAFGPADPFRTEALAPPRPLLTPGADAASAPCPPVVATTVYDVLEVVDLALCQNPRTREAWASARVQAAQVGLAQADFLPGVDARLSTTRARSDGQNETQYNASLTLSWLLYDFGARTANVEVSRQLLSAASATLDATVQDVFLAAFESYYNAQAARAAVSAALESEKASRASLAAAEVRYQVGSGTPADRLLAQTAWSQATLDRIRAEGTLKNALGTLANVMGLDANLPLRLAELPEANPDAAFERDLDALIGEARLRRPELKAAQAQENAARANVRYARAAGRPTLSLGAGPAWVGGRSGGSSFDSHSNSLGLTLNVPIFSGFSTTYAIRAAQARVEVASAQRESVRLQVALDVWTTYQSLITATQAIRTSADLLASAQQSQRVALGRYQAGVGSILDVLNAQSALASARLQRIQATLDWNVFRAALAKAVGSLDASLLNPATETRTP